MSNFRLIIDADPLVYRCGFAAEKHSYELVVENPMEQLSFVDGKTMQAWKKANKAALQPRSILGQTMNVDPLSVNFALQIVGSSLRALIREVKEKAGRDDMEVILLLSGQNNFRDEIATVKGYKANRMETAKPHWYQGIRNYLTDRWGAQVIDGREADDEASILIHMARQDEVDCCLATVDKDLDQVPGMHYDYAKKVFYYVGEDDAQAAREERLLTEVLDKRLR